VKVHSSLASVPSSSTSCNVPPPFSTSFSVDYSLTECSPLSLNNFDNAGILLVCTPLNGDNYNSWSCFMLMALSAKNKIGFIDGTLKKPSNIASVEFIYMFFYLYFVCLCSSIFVLFPYIFFLFFFNFFFFYFLFISINFRKRQERESFYCYFSMKNYNKLFSFFIFFSYNNSFQFSNCCFSMKNYITFFFLE
jgi:hypothetical protein